MDVHVSVMSPVVRCIITGENQTVLLFNELVVWEPEVPAAAGLHHWELPYGKSSCGESQVEAAQRIVYNRTGLFAQKVRRLVPKVTKHHGVVFNNNHVYFLVEDFEGSFARDEYASKKEGLFQWVEYACLSYFAIRRETLAHLKLAFEGYPE